MVINESNEDNNSVVSQHSEGSVQTVKSFENFNYHQMKSLLDDNFKVHI